ncbi:hypothetical protein AB0E88_13060 [Streptomyces sp. NPDC028635]|uniref:hypothetical protein n=1 Tax=Streptomyces sp. NPDC028635 TaxID=3154800 RepID=UPI0033D60B30
MTAGDGDGRSRRAATAPASDTGARSWSDAAVWDEIARPERIAGRRAAGTDLAEAYTGFPLD